MNNPNHTLSKRAKVSRSKSGCVNCKRRKKKCDEVKPICSPCFKRNVRCEYKLISDSLNDHEYTTDIIQCGRENLGDLVIEILDDESNFIIEDDDILKEYLCPSIQVKLPVELNQTEIRYLEYYCKEIIPNLSLVSKKFNHYPRLCIPVAFEDPGVLYCLILWGYRVLNEQEFLVESQAAKNYKSKIDSHLSKHVGTTDNFFQDMISYMLLVCMEASFGDTVSWARYFTGCFNLINKMPGNFDYLLKSPDGLLLAQNFAYFDVLASQSNENGTFYPISQYDQLLQYKSTYDPLQGCMGPLFIQIGRIISLLVEYEALKNGHLPECDRSMLLSEMIRKADKLEMDVIRTKPNMDCIDRNVEDHLTLFEAYQISCQLYIKQVIRRFPPSVPEVEIAFEELKKDIKMIIRLKEFKRSLAFPLMVLGICACTTEDRKEVEEFFEYLIKTCGYLCNYYKLYTIIKKLWKINQNGLLYVDWYRITKQMGWRLSLAR